MMLSSIVFLASLGFIYGAPQADKVNQRILLGSNTTDPSVLRLEQFPITCTATLISPQIILTAAHCFVNEEQQTTATYCFDLEGQRCEELEVVSYIIHPEYVNPKMVGIGVIFNDIAVGKLARPIKNVNPKSLANPDQDDPPTGYVNLMGWGLTELREPAKMLQTISLPIYDSEELDGCKSEEKIFVQQIHNLVGISCGDSGGPLLVGDTVFGVASAIVCWPNAFMLEEYGIYMSVQYYYKFIKDSMDKLQGNDLKMS